MDLLSERRSEREDRILETARRLIAERGYDGVGMRELASQSRVSVPTLYNLFGDKSALLIRAVESQFRELLASIDRHSKGTGIDLLLAIPAGCTRALLRAPQYAKAVLGVFSQSGQRSGVISIVAEITAGQFEIALARMSDEQDLESWVDPRALGQRLASHQIMVCLEWAGGHLNALELEAAMLYGPCMMLMGAVRDGAREVLEDQARASQENSRTRKQDAPNSDPSSTKAH
jgi:AcrR family transcriptional regulator